MDTLGKIAEKDGAVAAIALIAVVAIQAIANMDSDK